MALTQQHPTLRSQLTFRIFKFDWKKFTSLIAKLVPIMNVAKVTTFQHFPKGVIFRVVTFSQKKRKYFLSWTFLSCKRHFLDNFSKNNFLREGKKSSKNKIFEKSKKKYRKQILSKFLLGKNVSKPWFDKHLKKRWWILIQSEKKVLNSVWILKNWIKNWNNLKLKFRFIRSGGARFRKRGVSVVQWKALQQDISQRVPPDINLEAAEGREQSPGHNLRNLHQVFRRDNHYWKYKDESWIWQCIWSWGTFCQEWTLFFRIHLLKVLCNLWIYTLRGI